MSNELLSMFLDSEFVPHAYLDAVFSQVQTGGTHPLTNPKYIQQLQQRSSILLSHMDYYTNELTNELESQIAKLYASNSIVSYAYDPAAESNLKPTTRLEYYIDSLSISIHSLNDSIESLSTKLQNLRVENPSSERLLFFTKARSNLLNVQASLETLKSIVEISHDSSIRKIDTSRIAPTSTKVATHSVTVTKGELSSALDILNDTIVEQLNERKKMESEKEVDKVLISKIGEFCDLLPLLKNLGDFYSVYGAFVKRIQGEKESYLQTKALDDELSEQILK